MTDISQWLDSGEFIVKKQNAVLDQGFGNQSDGVLYLTNRQLAFQVSQSSLMRGLDLQIEGQKDVKVEFVWMPLELVYVVEKKGLSVSVETGGSLFQEVLGGGGLFGSKGDGRVFENGPADFKFSMTIFTNKDEWVEMISSQRDVLLDSIPQDDVSEPIVEDGFEGGFLKEKIIIKEVVKIKCRYCDTLYEQRLSRCPHCGGRQ